MTLEVGRGVRSGGGVGVGGVYVWEGMSVVGEGVRGRRRDQKFE